MLLLLEFLTTKRQGKRIGLKLLRKEACLSLMLRGLRVGMLILFKEMLLNSVRLKRGNLKLKWLCYIRRTNLSNS